jgi:hypothetical protein
VAGNGGSWLAVGAVVVGAALGYASSAAQEAGRRRHERRRTQQLEEREDRVRFESRRFEAYVALVTAANRVYAVARHPVSADGEGNRDTHAGQLNAAYEQFTVTLSPAFLLASSKATERRLADLARATRALLDSAVSGGADGPPEHVFRAHRDAVKQAEARMREEFGLVSP